MLAHVRAFLGGDLDRIERIMKLTGYVNAMPDFTEIPHVVNGASELFLDIFGEPAATPAPPSASRSCPSMSRSRSRGFFSVDNTPHPDPPPQGGRENCDGTGLSSPAPRASPEIL